MTSILSALVIVAILALAYPVWCALRSNAREVRKDLADIAAHAREQSRKEHTVRVEPSTQDPWEELEHTLDEARSNPLADKKALEQEIEELTRETQP